jgi:hypothetical protein
MNEAIHGRGDQIKEYRIAVDVFGRGESFDPKEDRIVRVQARDLRTKLSAYHEAAGDGEPIIIELPKGSYTPVFHEKQASARCCGGVAALEDLRRRCRHRRDDYRLFFSEQVDRGRWRVLAA